MATPGAPALPLAAGAFLGVGVARWLEAGGLFWGFLALAASLVLAPRRSVALVLATAGVGWISARSGAANCSGVDPLDLDRPVTVVGQRSAPWRRTAFGWSTTLTVDRLRQDGSFRRWPESVILFLPAGESPPSPSALRVRGFLRPPKPLANGIRVRAGPWRVSVKSARLLAASRQKGAHPLVHRARGAVSEALLQPEYGRGAALARALVLGDSSSVPDAWLISLRRAGLGHLLAVSGLHVGLVMAIAWALAFALRPQWRLLPCAIAVTTYLVIVGPRPSLLRSAVMALVAMLSLASERRPLALNAWAVAVAAMLIQRPALLERLDFQLSAIATLGLVALAPRLRQQMTRLPPVVGGGLAASVAAHVATLPWSLSVFHQWTPGAVVLNLVAVPWTALTLLLSLGGVLLGPLGAWLWPVLDLVATPFGWLADLPVRGVFSRVVVLPWAASAVLGTVLALVVGGRGWWRLRSISVGVVVALLTLRGSPEHRPRLVMLDVGQGEAVLLQDGDAAVLVDGGGGPVPGLAAREVAPTLARLGVRRLTGVVMTHPDLDHCAGLLELSYLVPIESAWATPGWRGQCYRNLIRRPGLRLRPLWSGESWSLGRWRFSTLHPAAGTSASGNERSLVLRAALERSGRVPATVLLTGDIGTMTERRLVDRYGSLLMTDLLKLGHHGSRSSTGEALLDATQPQLGVVSAGANSVYRHPSIEVARRLAARQVPLMRTDLDGQIVVDFDASSRLTAGTPWKQMKTVVAPCVESRHEADRGDRRPDGRRQELAGAGAGGDARRRDRQC